MRACVIFNPAARGDKARRGRRFLETLGSVALLRPTTGPGSARALTREALEAGETLVIAAGGDGTVYEVLNGMADVPGGFARAVLGVLPMGTANVFARELGMPKDLARAWQALAQGKERTIDGCRARFRDSEGREVTAHFAIVAGAGLDARAVECVDLRWKRRVGKLAYVVAALKALVAFRDEVRSDLGGPFRGRVLLAGNGRRYAGDLAVFEDGSLESGQLHLRGVETVSLGILARCLASFVSGRWLLNDRMRSATATRVRWEGEGRVPLQLDGEWVGYLPAELEILPGSLRVLGPGEVGK
ncbi:MAG: diacylglycerol kinase family lipid kinase [Verrucomicrobiales bacterium]|nr:diacylglycerol kinase family lipid kinase [Verrucomicrobiales bacterium]